MTETPPFVIPITTPTIDTLAEAILTEEDSLSAEIAPLAEEEEPTADQAELPPAEEESTPAESHPTEEDSPSAEIAPSAEEEEPSADQAELPPAEEEQAPPVLHGAEAAPHREERKQPSPKKASPTREKSPSSKEAAHIPAVRFVKRANKGKPVRIEEGKPTGDRVRPLHLKYKTLPKEELLRQPGQLHGHRQMRTETGPKTKNERARARIAKVMSRLYDDDD